MVIGTSGLLLAWLATVHGVEVSGAVPLPIPNRLELAARYVLLGVWRVIPRGPEHLLFVVGLLMLRSAPRAMAWQIAAFLVAQGTAIVLAIYGRLVPPASILEPLLGLSLGLAAADNLLESDRRRWRLPAVTCAGVLHGMALAGVLGAMGVPRDAFLTAVLAFASGVDLAQLAGMGVAVLIVGRFRRRSWYGGVIRRPIALAIAATGLYWFFERIGG